MTEISPDMREERLEIVNEEGKVIGLASREACHRDASLLHRVVHVLVLNRAESFLLQKRASDKEIQPGKWDTSVGGHLHPGEGFEEAARREMAEELGIEGGPLLFLHEYRWRTTIESELVRTYLCRHDGPFSPNGQEISEARFWSLPEVEGHLGDGTFAPNFEEEFARYLQWKGRK